MSFIKTDAFVMFEVGIPKDIGWAMATAHKDGTITRTCKGCGIESRDRPNPSKRVRAEFHHKFGCPIMERLLLTGSDGGSAVS